MKIYVASQLDSILLDGFPVVSQPPRSRKRGR